MQFIVFVAFAVALSLPPDGPPWPTISDPRATVAIVFGQVLAAGLVAAVFGAVVRRRLERQPAWLPGAQRRLGQANVALRFVLTAGLVAGAYGTDWSRWVRSIDWIRPLWGLDELLIISPFFVALIVAWIALYPADRGVRQVSLEHRLWLSEPARPVWSLGAYLAFMLRHHVLIIVVPMLPIVVANDAVSHEHYGRAIRMAAGIPWADQAVLVAVAGVVFLFAPVMLRYIWHTQRLPRGALRDRLEAICRHAGLTYRDILIWRSDGMVVNAAVMGLLRPVRYVLLSDGLLESMEDRQIEAVFGHEAGHVKHRHIEFYLLFAVLTMLVVGGVMELAIRWWPGLRADPRAARDYLQVAAMGMIVLLWGVAFGPVSRRFEWQADLFGARSVTPEPSGCDRPCTVHGTALPETAGTSGPLPAGLCATAADLFAEALHRIAILNGIPPEARSWRHSSIANRIGLLRRYARDPAAMVRLERSVMAIKLVLALGTALGLVVAAWLYWPPQWQSR